MVVLGFDVGGAHLKAARVEDGRVIGAIKIACPLWQGLDQLDAGPLHEPHQEVHAAHGLEPALADFQAHDCRKLVFPLPDEFGRAPEGDQALPPRKARPGSAPPSR